MAKDRIIPSKLNKENDYWKNEAIRLKFENEDALVELKVKELQREIELDKVTILTEERQTNRTNYSASKIQVKKQRTFQNILMPGLGSLTQGEKLKGGITMSVFSFLFLSTYLNFQNANSIRNEIDSLYYLEYLEQVRLKNEYRVSYYRTNFLLLSTVVFYLLNLIESNYWEDSNNSARLTFFPKFTTATKMPNIVIQTETNYTISWEFQY